MINYDKKVIDQDIADKLLKIASLLEEQRARGHGVRPYISHLVNCKA